MENEKDTRRRREEKSEGADKGKATMDKRKMLCTLLNDAY